MKRERWRGKTTAKNRKETSRRLIRNALKDGGKKKFTDLQIATELSPPALTRNLYEMCEEGEIKREGDARNKRWRLYSLDELGWEMLRRDEDHDSIDSYELGTEADDSMTTCFEASAGSEADKASLENAFQKEEMDVCVLTPVVPVDCLSYSVYTDKPPSDDVKREIRTIAKATRSTILDKMGTLNKVGVSSVPSFTIMFRFNSEKLKAHFKTEIRMKKTHETWKRPSASEMARAGISLMKSSSLRPQNTREESVRKNRKS